MKDIRLLKNDWSVLTVSRGGAVSLIRNLPLDQSVKVYNASIPRRGAGIYYSNKGDIERRDLIGPDGWDGCTKAFNHQYKIDPVRVCNDGPNEGKRYRYGSCMLCNAPYMEWVKCED